MRQDPTFEEFLELMATRPDLKVLVELKDYPEELGDFAYASAELTLSLCRKYGIFGKDRLTIVTFSIVPFNVLSRALTSVITILVYKKLSVPLKKITAMMVSWGTS